MLLRRRRLGLRCFSIVTARGECRKICRLLLARRLSSSSSSPRVGLEDMLTRILALDLFVGETTELPVGVGSTVERICCSFKTSSTHRISCRLRYFLAAFWSIFSAILLRLSPPCRVLENYSIAIESPPFALSTRKPPIINRHQINNSSTKRLIVHPYHLAARCAHLDESFVMHDARSACQAV